MANEEPEERQSIDAIGFAILCFLSDRENSAKGLRDLLEQFTELELSRSPMYRRMRQLVEQGLVVEEVRSATENNRFSLTEKGEKFTVEWSNTFRLLCSLALHALEYTKTEEYVNERK